MIGSLLKNKGLISKFQHSLNLENFNKCIHTALNSPYEDVKVSFYNHQGRHSRGKYSGKFILEIKDFKELIELTKDGGSICVTNIQMCHPELGRILLEQNLEEFRVKKYGMNCYLSQDGHGADLHTDGKYVNTIQLSGQKKWTYATKEVDHYLARDQNGEFKEGMLFFEEEEIRVPKESMEFSEIILNEGETLSLKPGTLHSAQAIGLSLAVNLYVIQ